MGDSRAASARLHTLGGCWISTHGISRWEWLHSHTLLHSHCPHAYSGLHYTSGWVLLKEAALGWSQLLQQVAAVNTAGHRESTSLQGRVGISPRLTGPVWTRTGNGEQVWNPEWRLLDGFCSMLNLYVEQPSKQPIGSLPADVPEPKKNLLLHFLLKRIMHIKSDTHFQLLPDSVVTVLLQHTGSWSQGEKWVKITYSILGCLTLASLPISDITILSNSQFFNTNITW